jgi:predicted metal-dependent hydrolase
MKNQKKLIPHFVILDKLGTAINVPVRYSKKAKRIIIRINSKGVDLVLPNKNLDVGYKFLLNKEAWVRQKLHSRKEAHTEIDNKTIPLFGKVHSLLYINSSHTVVKIIENVIHVYSPSDSDTKALIKFLQHKLLVEITEIVGFLNKQLKLYVSKIKIIANKTRWGSCSSKSVLCFNWRLIFAPQEILHYVIIHEMCHLIEMNHSKSFWKLVTDFYPNYQSARLWLKQNGSRLHQYCIILIDKTGCS